VNGRGIPKVKEYEGEVEAGEDGPHRPTQRTAGHEAYNDGLGDTQAPSHGRLRASQLTVHLIKIKILDINCDSSLGIITRRIFPYILIAVDQ
jgi:hypothetical protein